MKKKQYKILTLILAIILCCFFSTIAYSAVYSTMNITGIAYARVVKDVRITDFKINDLSFSATTSYEEFSSNTISSKFNLIEPASSMIFDVEVTNYGSSDVGILNLIGTLPEGLSYEIINYNLEDKICDDTGKCNQMAVKTFQIKFTGTPGEYEVNLEFDFRIYHKVTYTNITNNGYPTEVIDGGNLNITFTENLKKVSVLSDGTEVSYYESISSGQNLIINSVSGDIEFKRKKELVARLVSGEIDEVGSEVCIKDECFYIISNDGTTVTMLAKYNLYVGGKYEDNVWTAYGDEATGKQDSTMLGFVSSGQPYKGVTAFSDNDSYYTESIVEVYVNNYNTYLTTLGVTPMEARLITIDELISLGCSEDDTSCSNAPSWVYLTSYWTGSRLPSQVWFVYTNKLMSHTIFSYDHSFGVRPVIEMSIDDIKLPAKPVMVSGDYDTVGSEVAIGDEHFYVISSTDDTVTMLAKYNVTLEDVPKQSVDAGTTVFSSDSKKGTYYSDYSGSIVEGYVNNYELYLKNIGINPLETRLILKEELTNLGCDEDLKMCEDNSFIYSTAYWTGSQYDYNDGWQCRYDGQIVDCATVNIWTVWFDGYGNFDSSSFDAEDFGVRPVITISKSNF